MIEGETGYEEEITILKKIGWAIPDNLFDEIKDWHSRRGFGCNAHGEGLYCCLDFLLGDFEEEK